MEVARIKTALQRRKRLRGVQTDTPNSNGARRNPQEATVSQCNTSPEWSSPIFPSSYRKTSAQLSETYHNHPAAI